MCSLRPVVPSSWIPCNLLAEADATRAVNAAGHVGRDQRPEVLVLYDAFLVSIARDVAAESHREILQFALATLIADRAIERMVYQTETPSSLSARQIAAGDRVNTFMPSDNRSRTSRHTASAPFSTSTRHMRQFAAIGQLLVIAKPRHIGFMLVGYFDQHLTLGAL